MNRVGPKYGPEEFRIEAGVRQDCVISPYLFNFVADSVFSEVYEDSRGLKSENGAELVYLEYADDAVLFAETEADLQAAIDTTVRVSARYDLRVNAPKTVIMASVQP